MEAVGVIVAGNGNDRSSGGSQVRVNIVLATPRKQYVMDGHGSQSLRGSRNGSMCKI